jgi:hypothetical protein
MRKINLNRKGSISAFMLVIGLILSIVGLGLLQIGYQARIRAIRTANEMSARAMADAGLTKAMYQLSVAFNDGSLKDDALPVETDSDVPNCYGKYSYTVTGNKSAGYTITSTGKYNGAQRTTEFFAKAEGGDNNYALFAKGSIAIKNSGKIDWYNNKVGDLPLKIGTNSTEDGAVYLYNSSIVNGDIQVGPGGDTKNVIEQKNSSKFTGQASVASSAYEPSPVIVPESLNSAPSGGSVTSNKTITTSGKYSSINLGNSKKLTITGNVEMYITGNVTLGNSSSIEIAKDSSLTLYYQGSLTTQNSSSINNLNKIPVNLKIMGLPNSSSVTLKNSSDIYGVIYTPDSALTIDNSATIYGSVTAKSFEIKNSGKIMYDVSLRGDKNSQNQKLTPKRWREY